MAASIVVGRYEPPYLTILEEKRSHSLAGRGRRQWN
jgi:hypothetical protein